MLSLLAFQLTACEYKIDGVIQATENLIFNYHPDSKKMKERERKGKELSKVIPAGHSSVQIQIEKDSFDIKSNGQEIVFKLPKGTPIPKNGGRQLIPAQLSGQSYDLLADVIVDVTRSAERNDFEQCSEPYTYEDCSCDVAGQIQCTTRTTYLNGEKDVSYYFVYTKRDVQIDFLKPGAQNSSGRFNGTRTDSEKVYTYKGRCEIDPHQYRQIRRTERIDLRHCRPDNGPEPRPRDPPPRPRRPRV